MYMKFVAMRKNFLSFSLSTSVLLSFPFNKLHDVIMFTYICAVKINVINFIFSLKNFSCVELYELSYLFLSELQFHFISFFFFCYLSCCVLVFGTELNNFWCHPEYIIKNSRLTFWLKRLKQRLVGKPLKAEQIAKNTIFLLFHL